jgi:probable rRNA maturation factor
VANLQNAVRVSRRDLEGVARRVLRRLGLAGAGVSVAVVDDRRMRSLNRRWRGVARTTDVLAFPLGGGPGEEGAPGLLGEVVISAERARRQAREAGVPVRSEMARLVIHGLLHLAGDDDSTNAKAERMWARQERLLKEVTPQRWTT